MLEEQAILDEYQQQHCYEEVGAQYDSQLKELLTDDHSDARGFQGGGGAGVCEDGELTELNHQIKETELGNEDGVGTRQRGGRVVSQNHRVGGRR